RIQQLCKPRIVCHINEIRIAACLNTVGWVDLDRPPQVLQCLFRLPRHAAQQSHPVVGKIGPRRLRQDALKMIASLLERARIQQGYGIVVPLFRRVELQFGGAAVPFAYREIHSGALQNLGRRVGHNLLQQHAGFFILALLHVLQGILVILKNAVLRPFASGARAGRSGARCPARRRRFASFLHASHRVFCSDMANESPANSESTFDQSFIRTLGCNVKSEGCTEDLLVRAIVAENGAGRFMTRSRAYRIVALLVSAWILMPASFAQKRPQDPDDLTPALRIPVDPLGFTAPSVFYLTYRMSSASLGFFDNDHLLFTFRVGGLLRRLPSDDNDDDDQQIRAVVLDAHTGQVIRQAQWRMHDRAQYMWPWKEDKFLIRVRDQLFLTDDSLK